MVCVLEQTRLLRVVLTGEKSLVGSESGAIERLYALVRIQAMKLMCAQERLKHLRVKRVPAQVTQAIVILQVIFSAAMAEVHVEFSVELRSVEQTAADPIHGF